jgi:TonB family protein
MCEDDQPPEALLTPNPVVPFVLEKLPVQGSGDRLNPDRVNLGRVNVRVSFLVGLDGRVQSAFVLDSGGADDDSAVLRAVRGWRYRPARCNGVPTSSEIRVRFSIP